MRGILLALASATLRYITVATVAVLAVLNIWGADYFRRELAAISSDPARGIVFLNIAGLYYTALLILPVGAWLGLVPMRMTFARLAVQVLAAGIGIALLMQAFLGGKASEFAHLVVLVCLLVAAAVEGLGISTLLPLLSLAMGRDGSDAGAPVGALEAQVRDALVQVGLSPTLGTLLAVIVAALWIKGALMRPLAKRALRAMDRAANSG